MTSEGPVHRPQPCVSWNVMFRHGPVAGAHGAVGLRRRARALRPASPPGRVGGRSRSFAPPSRQSKGRDGVSLFRAPLRGRARGAAGGCIAAARFARVIARARRHTHFARPFPPGCFFAAPSRRFLQKRRKAAPGEPPLSTFILHHPAKCQAPSGTENEKYRRVFMECRQWGAGAEPAGSVRRAGRRSLPL